jgi:3-isopropylmalate dehydrogenase
MYLVMDPWRFDVIVTTNMFGDIVSDLAAGIVGGLGIAPSANIGDEHTIFEPVHGSAPDIAGKGIANPSAMILSATMMLKHFGYFEEAVKIENALEKVIYEGKTTPDLGGKLKTMEMVQEIIKNLQ